MKLAGKFDTITATPPLEMWGEFVMPMMLSVQSIGPLRMPNLRSIMGGMSAHLAAVDLHGLAGLLTAQFTNSPNLTDVRVGGCPLLTSLVLFGNAMPTPVVDRVLAELVANGASNGGAMLNGGSSGPPSDPDGQASRAVLISRGWTVSNN